MGLRPGLSDGHTSHKLMLLPLIKSLAIFDPMFWVIVLLEPVTIWKLHLDVWQEVISEDAVSE